MSISSSIDINLTDKYSNISTKDILQLLLNNGWVLSHNGSISYIPLGDKECVNWQIDSIIKYNDLIKLIIEKEKNMEPNGLILTWKNTKIGGQFLFWGHGKLSVNTNLTRQVISLTNNLEITNFQWYLTRILPILQDSFEIESFSCEEIR